MNRSDLTLKLAEQTGLAQATLEVIVGKTFKLMAASLAEGEDVAIGGFGSLSVKTRAARQGRNPRTQALIEIPATRTVQFKPAKALREAVNGN